MQTIEKRFYQQYQLQCDYAQMALIESLLVMVSGRIVEVEYLQSVNAIIKVDQEFTEQFIAQLNSLAQGKVFAAFSVTLLIGLVLWIPNRGFKRELKVREGFLIVVLFWVTLGSVGALPFLMSTSIEMNAASAFFESFSGLTTTGATVIENIDNLPKSIVFYRQMLQWFGGMGIIVLAVAVYGGCSCIEQKHPAR